MLSQVGVRGIACAQMTIHLYLLNLVQTSTLDVTFYQSSFVSIWMTHPYLLCRHPYWMTRCVFQLLGSPVSLLCILGRLLENVVVHFSCLVMQRITVLKILVPKSFFTSCILYIKTTVTNKENKNSFILPELLLVVFMVISG